MQLHVEQDRVGGVAWLLAASDHVEVAGGMGSMWSNDPSNTLVGVILSTDVFGGPFPPPAVIRTSGPARTPRSTTDQEVRHVIA